MAKLTVRFGEPDHHASHVLCLTFVVIAVRVELYLVELIPLILFAQHNQNVRIFLEAGSCTELPRCTTTMNWLAPQRQPHRAIFVVRMPPSRCLWSTCWFVGPDASTGYEPQSAPLMRFLIPLTTSSCGYWGSCVPGIPTPAPSAFGLSQPLDGFFVLATCLPCFIQTPSMGFKELGGEFQNLSRLRRLPGASAVSYRNGLSN